MQYIIDILTMSDPNRVIFHKGDDIYKFNVWSSELTQFLLKLQLQNPDVVSFSISEDTAVIYLL